jgi:hypothetical protein
MTPAQPVIDGLRRNRETFEAFCRSLSDEELARPVPPDERWTVKDFIIHNLTFDALTTQWAERVASGQASPPETMDDGRPFDVDVWNDERVREFRPKSLDELFAASIPERRRFEEALAHLTDEDLQRVVDFPGDNKRDPARVPFGLFLHGLVRHDPIHAVDMLKALPERAEDPELRAWVDDRMVEWYQQAMSGPARRQVLP